MSVDTNLDQNFFDIEDSGDIIGLARSLVNGRHPGILGTVDGEGRPRLRWMSSLAFDDFPVFHSLTAPGSRKVAEIEHHSGVSWMFFNSDNSLILNLGGKAKIVSDAAVLERVWGRIVDTSHAYFLNEYAREPRFVVIETLVDSIECSSPKNALRFQIDPSGLSSPTRVHKIGAAL